MLKRFIGLILLLLPLLPNAVRAQDAAIWPPDLTKLFAPDVKVLNVETNLWPVVDNEARTIQIPDEQTRSWKIFNYPSEIKKITSTSLELENGLVRLNVSHEDSNGSYIWSLDPTNGTFQHYENACINWKQQGENGYGEISLKPHWEFHRDDKLGRMSLCYTGTGTSEYLLPKDGYWQNLEESPDGKRLLLWNSARRYPSYGSNVQVYSYNIATQELAYLGDYPIGEAMEMSEDKPVLRWLSDTEGFYYSGGMSESSQKSLFYFDMSKPDSLTYFMTGWADYHDDPPRYEYLQTYNQVSHRQDLYGYYPECQVQLFYFSQPKPTLHSYTLGRDCFGNVVRNQTMYFYVGYGKSELTTLTLYSLDTETNERETWFADKDLLALDSISPDGRYAILMLNDGTHPPIYFSSNDGSDHSLPFEDLDPWWYSNFGITTAHIAIFDTKEGKIVYDNPSWKASGKTTWVDATSFMADSSEDQHPLMLFRLTEKGLVQVENWLPEHDYLDFSPDNQLALLKQNSQFVVYNLLTGTTTPLMQSFQSDDFNLYMEWIDNQQIEIRLYRVKDYHQIPTAIFTIRIPQDGNE